MSRLEDSGHTVDMADGEVEADDPRMNSDTLSQYVLMGRAFPRSEVRFFAQVIILYIVIFTCLGNLSVGSGELNALWISLLSSCVGYLLPAPHIPSKLRTSGVLAPAQ